MKSDDKIQVLDILKIYGKDQIISRIFSKIGQMKIKGIIIIGQEMQDKVVGSLLSDYQIKKES